MHFAGADHPAVLQGQVEPGLSIFKARCAWAAGDRKATLQEATRSHDGSGFRWCQVTKSRVAPRLASAPATWPSPERLLPSRATLSTPPGERGCQLWLVASRQEHDVAILEGLAPDQRGEASRGDTPFFGRHGAR